MSRLIFAGSLLCLVAASGCATKGFVNRELEQMRADMRAGDEHLLSEIQDVGNSATEALARADMALDGAGAARDLALGNAGYEEVGSFEITFRSDSFSISSSASTILEEAAYAIAANPATLVDVYGFTDSSGPADYNLVLGQKRAEAVMRHLVARTPGQLSRFAAVSFGEEQTVAIAGGAQRRVVVSLIARTPEQAATEEEITQAQ